MTGVTSAPDQRAVGPLLQSDADPMSPLNAAPLHLTTDPL
jgi:hypothetical protein